MKSESFALIPIRDFNSEFTKLGENLAVRDEASNKQGHRDNCLETETQKEKSGETADSTNGTTSGTTNGTINGPNSTTGSVSQSARNQYKKNQFERSVRKVIHRYKKRSFL